MNSLQFFIGTMLSFLAAMILLPLITLELQDAILVWSFLSIFWGAGAYGWLQNYMSYKRSGFKSFEAWWAAEQLKNDMDN